MRAMAIRLLVMTAAAVLMSTEDASAGNPNGVSFRAVGWSQGEASISAGQITCQIPSISGGFPDGAFAMGLWNTHGARTLFFPDPNNPGGNPCGGWIQLANNMVDQAVAVDHVDLTFRVPGIRRLPRPARHGFPVACRSLRRSKLYLGTVVNPVNSSQESSSSGAPNVAFIQLVPMVSPDLIHCLREEYAGLAADVYVSLQLVINAKAVGITDAGNTITSNTLRYTLNLRHTCGNGRVDDGETCDPATSFNSCAGSCSAGACTQDSSLPCNVNADCVGSCVAAGDPEECVCLY